MSKKIQWLLGMFIAVLAFAANPHGPLGGFWRPDRMSPNPTNLQLPFFIILNIFESVTFAGAIILLLFHFPKKAFSPLSLTQTQKAYACLLWFLGNWWAHDSLHAHIGMNLQSLLYLEYGFHLTMMLASAYLLLLVRKLYSSKNKS